MNNEDQLIDNYLADCEDFSDDWLGEQMPAAQIVIESNAFWKKYMELFCEMLEKNGLKGREDLIASKQCVGDAWVKQRTVFLKHLEKKGIVAFRYNGGKNQPCGYVLLKDKKPFRILSLRINRPDPNIGNVELPFPLSTKERPQKKAQ